MKFLDYSYPSKIDTIIKKNYKFSYFNENTIKKPALIHNFNIICVP